MRQALQDAVPPTAAAVPPPHHGAAPVPSAGVPAPPTQPQAAGRPIQRTPQLEQLLNMGFSAEQGDFALHATGGDVNAAAELLLSTS